MPLEYPLYLEALAPTADTGLTSHPPTAVFANPGVCLVCKRKATQVFEDGVPYKDGIDYMDWSMRAWSCFACGWWDTMASGYVPDDPYAVGPNASIHRRGILSVYKNKDRSEAIASLHEFASRRPESLYGPDVTSIDMEHLVQAVFREHFDCTVEHVGRSADGAIDLLVAHSEGTIAVQVKRRQNPQAKENVQLVREILAAVQLAGLRRGMIVSTAESFTAPAMATAKKATRLPTIGIDTYELIDFKRFVEIMKLTSGSAEPAWRKHLPSIRRKE